MKSIDNVGITYVNAVLGRGTLNGVVNIQLGALQFDTTSEGTVSGDLSVCCRLRMDLHCAVQIRNSLNDLLAQVEKAQAAAMANGAVVNESGPAPGEKPN